MKYGDKLREIKANIEAKNTARQKREAELERIKIEQEISEIEKIFENAWIEMETAIVQDRMPKGVKVSDYFSPFRQHHGIANSKHPYHDIYIKWTEEAHKNGLKLYIVNNHDGMGMKDWEVVTFTVEN